MHLYLPRCVDGVMVGLHNIRPRSTDRSPKTGCFSDPCSTSTHVIRCSSQTELRAVLDERSVPTWVFKHHSSHCDSSLELQYTLAPFRFQSPSFQNHFNSKIIMKFSSLATTAVVCAAAA